MQQGREGKYELLHGSPRRCAEKCVNMRQQDELATRSGAYCLQAPRPGPPTPAPSQVPVAPGIFTAVTMAQVIREIFGSGRYGASPSFVSSVASSDGKNAYLKCLKHWIGGPKVDPSE